MSLLITPASCCGCAEACISCSGPRSAISWGGCCNDVGEPGFSGIAGPQCPPSNPVPWFGSCNRNCPRETIRYACCRIDGPSLSRTDFTLIHDGTPHIFPDSCIGVDGAYEAQEGSQCTVVNYATCIRIAGTKKIGDVTSFASLLVTSRTSFPPPDPSWAPCNLLRLISPNGGEALDVFTRLLIVEGGSIVQALIGSNCFGFSGVSLNACEIDDTGGTVLLDVSSTISVDSSQTQFTYDMNLINDSASLVGKVSVPTPWLFAPGIQIGQMKNKDRCTGI